MSLAPSVWIAPDIRPDTLHIIKGFLAYDGLMGILENRPFAFIDIVALLILEMLAGLEVDGVTEIFPFFEDIHENPSRKYP